MNVLQKTFLPNCFQMCRSLPSASLFDSGEETSLPACRQLKPSSLWPLQDMEVWFSSHLQCECHSSVSHLLGTEEAILERGKQMLIHLAWAMGILAAELCVFFLPDSTLWVRAEHVWLPCRTQLCTGLGKWGEKLKRAAKLMFPLTAESPLA